MSCEARGEARAGCKEKQAMTIVTGTYVTAQTNTVLVAAIAARIIRVRQMLLTTFGGTSFKLVSDPGGASETDLTPPLQSYSVPLLLPLGRTRSVVTARGKALGVTTAFDGAATSHSVMIWYDVVD
jgi:hypothetical protein